jgi:hypothetical protein
MRLVAAALGLAVALAALLFSLPAARPRCSGRLRGLQRRPDPIFDPVNVGLRRSRGRGRAWFGASRFYSSCSGGSVGCDTTVQKYGGSTNPSRVAVCERRGRSLFSVDTTDTENLVLSSMAHVLGQLRRQAHGFCGRHRADVSAAIAAQTS